MRIGNGQETRFHLVHDAQDKLANAAESRKNRSTSSQSEHSVQLAQHAEELKDVPEVRSERVAEVRRLLSDGGYEGTQALARTAEAIIKASGN